MKIYPTLIALLCVFPFCSNTSYSQTPHVEYPTTVPIDRVIFDADKLISTYFRTLAYAADCTNNFDFSHYEDLYDARATIVVGHKNGTKTTYLAKDYFNVVHRLCGTSYSKMKVWADPFIVDSSHVQVDNKGSYSVKMPVNQHFIGYRKDGTLYQDMTIKVMIIEDKRGIDGKISPKIMRVEANETN